MERCSSVRNNTAAKIVTIKTKFLIGKAELTTAFVFEPVFVTTRRKTSVFPFEQVNRIEVVNLYDTDSEFSAFAENVLSSTEMSEMCLSENEQCKKTDSQLLKAIFCPDLSSVLSVWGKRRETN